MRHYLYDQRNAHNRWITSCQAYEKKKRRLYCEKQMTKTKPSFARRFHKSLHGAEIDSANIYGGDFAVNKSHGENAGKAYGVLKRAPLANLGASRRDGDARCSCCLSGKWRLFEWYFPEWRKGKRKRKKGKQRIKVREKSENKKIGEVDSERYTGVEREGRDGWGKRKGGLPGWGMERIKLEINVNDLTAREGEREEGESIRGT